MRVFIVVLVLHDEPWKQGEVIIKSVCSTKERAEQFVRESYKGFSRELFDFNGTRLEIREYGVV
ncbi:hypothetical protein [Clostridium sp. HBUAS56010]|uniref:DUF7336 domain-containing protein n=1 Tax=Clostridium sp. HBUAS56010 TaxID=2571127 RepID=UPI0011776E75|nr:hypothetical protein [Clostridium sp. HBUAS56010]